MTARSVFLATLSIMTMMAAAAIATNTVQGLNYGGTNDRIIALLTGLKSAVAHMAAATVGIAILFSSRESRDNRTIAAGIVLGCSALVAILRLQLLDASIVRQSPARLDSWTTSPVHMGMLIGVILDLLCASFALRVTLRGQAAFGGTEPKRISGRRALHGDARWMSLEEAKTLFPQDGGIVIGERYRVDRDPGARASFRAGDRASWGRGGKAPLLCFDASFGSSHGLVFAGSGGFKTTSVTIPTALKWGGSLILLDPSSEVAPMVKAHREANAKRVRMLDPQTPHIGFNALDWIGKFASTKEEDIAAVASWIMSDAGRPAGGRDDFFRAAALQLLTALIADVCLSGRTSQARQTLRQVRTNLAEPEPKLRARLQEIHDRSQSSFVKENVAAFVNMTPETFSGVYANAIRETHWLSYPNYAALVSGSFFGTDEIAEGTTDVILNIDLKTLETHAGLARVIIGSLLNAVYNRGGDINGRVLFLIDEAARLGFMRILETARDVGRKYGITLVLLYQSIGQLRETYGGRDASSKWFESASWVSFAAINDPETAEYISRRCGTTTVEVDHLTRNSQARGSSSTRSKQIAARPLIQPHEVLLMRNDEQIIFTAGHAPLRCGRAIWFRRKDMRLAVEEEKP